MRADPPRSTTVAPSARARAAASDAFITTVARPCDFCWRAMLAKVEFRK
jgi:hypothetical protein